MRSRSMNPFLYTLCEVKVDHLLYLLPISWENTAGVCLRPLSFLTRDVQILKSEVLSSSNFNSLSRDFTIAALDRYHSILTTCLSRAKVSRRTFKRKKWLLEILSWMHKWVKSFNMAKCKTKIERKLFNGLIRRKTIILLKRHLLVKAKTPTRKNSNHWQK